MRRSLLPSLLAVLLAGPVAPAPQVKDKAPPTTYWPTVVGATLEYQFASSTQTEVVTAVERKGDVTTVAINWINKDGTSSPYNKVEIRKDGIFMTEEVGQAYDPPVCLLKLPLKAGDKWQTESKRPDLGSAYRFAREVGETRVIETPAGKFEAVQILCDTAPVGDRPADPKCAFWYAKGVGLLQIEGTRTLKAYTPGK
jgi:hypothetical protein